METERLILRPFEETEEDLALILALYSDPEIMCYVPYDLLNGEQAKAHLKRIAEEWHREKARNFEMAVILKDGGTPIGRAHFHLQEAASAPRYRAVPSGQHRLVENDGALRHAA